MKIIISSRLKASLSAVRTDDKGEAAHITSVVAAFNKSAGTNFKPEAYEGWIEGDADDWSKVEKFGKAVENFLGDALFNYAEGIARTDAVLQQKLFPAKKLDGGGYDLKKIVAKFAALAAPSPKSARKGI